MSEKLNVFLTVFFKSLKSMNFMLSLWDHGLRPVTAVCCGPESSTSNFRPIPTHGENLEILEVSCVRARARMGIGICTHNGLQGQAEQSGKFQAGFLE